MNEKLLKLASLIFKFQKVATDKAELTVNGDVAEGAEVLVTNESGELVQAEDGEYKTEENILVVVDGKISEVKELEKEPEQEPEKDEAEVVAEEIVEEVVEEQPDEKDNKIAELEKMLEDKEAVIAELQAKIQELENEINKPVEEPVEMAKTAKENDSNIFNKYFK